MSHMRTRKGIERVNWRVLIEFVGALAVIILMVLVAVWFLMIPFHPDALASARATTFAVSCTSLINIHAPGDVPQEIQTAWNDNVSADINRSCAETEDGRVSFREVEVECDPLDTDDGGCRIYNFNLPQECATDSLACELSNRAADNYWSAYIAGLGDPRYLLYYEAFPEGPSQHWEALPENAIAMADIFIGGAVNVMFFGAAKAARVVPGIGRRLADLSPGQILRNGDEIAEAGRFNRVARMWRWVRGGDVIKHSVEDVSRMATGSSVARYLSDEALETLGRTGARNLVDDLLEYRVRNQGQLARESFETMDRQIDDILVRHFDDAGVSVSREQRERMAAELSNMYKGADEVVTGAGPRGLSEREYWRLVTTANSLTDDLLDSAGRLNWDKISELAQATDESVTGFRAIPQRARDVSWAQVKETSYFIGCRSNALRMALLMNADDLTDNQELELAGQAAGIGGQAVLCGGRSVPRTVSNVMRESARGTALYGAYGSFLFTQGYLASKMESMSSKYRPDGVNTITLKKPFLFMLDLPMSERVFRLNEYANYYYVSLDRDDIGQGDRRRFYLVSPLTTRNLDSDNPHVEVYHKRLECKRPDEIGGNTGLYLVQTQASWNGGEVQEPFRDDWNNEMLVNYPFDPNTEGTPGLDAPAVLSATTPEDPDIWANGKKECYPLGLLESIENFWSEQTFTVDSVAINLENMQWKTKDGEPNYGYNSADLDEKTLEASLLIGTIVAEIAVIGLTGGIAAPVVVLWASGAGYTLVGQQLDRAGMWPEH